MIELSGVVASYRSGFARRRRVILDQIAFRIPEGAIAGYLGVNGAGKTTTIKLIVGINEPDSGTIQVGKLDAGTPESKRLIGYLPENPYFYEYLSPLEALDFYGRLSGVAASDRRPRALAVLEEVGLGYAAERPVREFSKGMRQRLGLAQALLHAPPLLVLDEPLTGLDPMGRLALRDIIARQRQAGRTVFFSSHILSDVEAVCDHIVILDAGKIAYEGSVEALLKADSGAYRVAFDGVSDDKIAAIREAAGAPVERRGVQHEVQCADRAAADQPPLEAVRAGGGRLASFQPLGLTLEDYFLKTYGNTAVAKGGGRVSSTAEAKAPLFNVSAILAVAQNTFKESARNRVLYALVGATVLVSGLWYVLASVSASQDVSGTTRRLQIVADVSMSAIALLGTLCAIFLGTNLVYVEVERRTIYTILARPISRGEFIVGKFLGLAAVVLAAVAIMATGFTLIFCLYGGLSDAAGPAALSWRHLVALGFTAIELVVVVAIALLFSVIAHPIEGAIFSFVVTLACHTTSSLNDLAQDVTRNVGGVEASGGAVFAAQVLNVLYKILPNLEDLNYRAEAVHGLPIDARVAGASALHALVYTALLLVLAVLAFRKKVL